MKRALVCGVGGFIGGHPSAALRQGSGQGSGQVWWRSWSARATGCAGWTSTCDKETWRQGDKVNGPTDQDAPWPWPCEIGGVWGGVFRDVYFTGPDGGWGRNADTSATLSTSLRVDEKISQRRDLLFDRPDSALAPWNSYFTGLVTLCLLQYCLPCVICTTSMSWEVREIASFMSGTLPT